MTQPSAPAAIRGRDLSRNRAGEAARTKGERKVGAELDKLARHGWRVLHSVPSGVGESTLEPLLIDHVLIGPGGVFTVNTKCHPGANVWVASQVILVDGQPVPYLRTARHEGQRAARLLTATLGRVVPVRPALVFLTDGAPSTIDYLQQPDDVLVLDALVLPGAFARRTGVLGADAVEAVFEVARWEGTWVR